MGRLLDKLRETSPVYDLKVDRDGFILVGRPEHREAFNDLVREAAGQSGGDFVIFATSDGQAGYSQMFVMPLED